MSAQGFSDVGDAGPAQQGEGEITADGHGLGSSTAANLRQVFAHGDVPDIVQAILDAPVVAEQHEEARGIGLGGR